MARPKAEDELSEVLMKPRTAECATLQAATMLPRGGGTANVLSQSKQPGIKLIHMPGVGLFIQFKGKGAFTSDANIRDVWYQDEPDTSLK